MRIRIICIFVGIFLISGCAGRVDFGPSNTPDPLEITVMEFEYLRSKVNELAQVAADTPVQDLEMIVRQMTALTNEIKEYEFPLEAAQAHSTLYNFSWNTEQCFFGIFAEYLLEDSDQEPMSDYKDRCDQVQVYEETFELMIQELKETIVDK
jgi:hypothetical protein